MSLKATGTKCRLGSFPRVSGDEPPTFTFNELEKMFSPRERG